MRNSLICLICSLLICFDAIAQEVTLCGKLEQGELLYGTAKDAKKIIFSNNEYIVNDKGEFLIAIPRDAEQNQFLEVVYNDNMSEKYNIQIKKHKWHIQYINGVAQNKVTPSVDDESEILRERTDMKNALSRSDISAQYWKDGFLLPLNGRISGHFGNQRIFNKIPKNYHSGTDIAAPKGDEIKASGNGKILLAGGNYFFSGNMVIIDHGQGLQTIYAHLDKALAKVGQEVKKGDVIGLVGTTGRSTGPHLHWGATVNNVRFRPHSLLENHIQSCQNLYIEDLK